MLIQMPCQNLALNIMFSITYGRCQLLKINSIFTIGHRLIRFIRMFRRKGVFCMKQPAPIDVGTQMDVVRYCLSVAREDLETAQLTFGICSLMIQRDRDRN